MRNELIKLCERFEQEDIRYLIVGGLAVLLHGYLRTTSDLDLVIQLNTENLQKALNVLKALHYKPRAPVELGAFADAEKRNSWINEKGMPVFSLWNDTNELEIDIFVTEPFHFASVFERSILVSIDKQPVRVIGLDDLIDMKMKVGRHIDLADVENLKILKEKNNAEA